MHAARWQGPLSSAEETPVEKDVGRILPPDKEDLSGGNPSEYGLCVIGEHTVAGVILTNRPAVAIQQEAEELARQAEQHARQANALADLARRHAEAHRQGGGFRDQAFDDLMRDLASGAISPNAAARELLELRAMLVSRYS